MIDTMRSEWIKLATVRVHRVLVLLALALALLIVTLVTALVPDADEFSGRGLSELVAGATLISIVLLATVVILGYTGEHGSGTLRVTYTATPSVTRVIGSKFVVSAVALSVATTLLLMVCWGVGVVVVRARGGAPGLSMGDGSLGGLVAMVALAVTLGWFGFGVGVIVRNSPAAVTLFLLWPLLLENLLAGVLFVSGADGLVRWLPYQAALSATNPSPGSDQLGRPWGLVWFGVVSLGLAGFGVLLERRRDA